MRITKSFVDKIDPPPVKPNGQPDQKIYRDSAIEGFGLRVTSSGAKSFIVEKRIKGKNRRMTLGKYGHLTVEEARKEAMSFLGSVAKGNNPIADQAAERARSVTLQEVFNDYLLSRRDLKPATVKDYRIAIDHYLEHWLNKPIVEITKDMVGKKHQVVGLKSKVRANNTMRVLRALFNHAKVKYEDEKGAPIITVNPVDRLSDTRAWYKVRRRESYLKAHQLKPWYQATLQLNRDTSRDLFHLLLFTGLRRSEGSRLTWDMVDLQEMSITIPDTKNRETHVLPLSDFLYDMLKRRESEMSSPFVFPSESDTGFLKEPKTAVKRVSKLSGVTFTLHDLRRTFITHAESLDIPAYALKRLLNHKDQRDVTAGYIGFDIDRLRGPMQRISEFMLSHIDAN